MNKKYRFILILVFMIILQLFITGCSDPSGGSEDVESNFPENPPVTDGPIPPGTEPNAKNIDFSLEGCFTVTDKLTGKVMISCVNNNLLYTGCMENDDILRIYDISDPLNPHFLGQADITTDGSGSISDIYVRDDIVFCAMYTEGIAIVDAGNPANPRVIGVNNYTEACALAVKGDYLYCGKSSNFYVFDISNLSNPRKVAGISSLDGDYPCVTVSDIYISGDYAFVTDEWDQYIAVVGIKDPCNPTVKKRYMGNQWKLNGNSWIQKLIVKESYAYLATFDGLAILNVSNPLDVTEAGFLETSGGLYNIVLDDNYVYCSMYEDNMYYLLIINIENPAVPVICSSIFAGYHFQRHALSFYKNGMDTFALCFNREGMDVIDISNQETPVEVGLFPYYNSFVSPECEKIIVKGDYAYMTKGIDTNSLVIFDISDPSSPLIAGKLPHVPTQFTDFEAVDIVLYGDYAYLQLERERSDYESLAIINCSDKENPVFEGYCPDIIGFRCFTVYEDKLYIYDLKNKMTIMNLTNPQNPAILAEHEFEDKSTLKCMDILINKEDSRIIAYIAYTDILSIIDITDPMTPIKLGNLEEQGMPVAYKLAVRDNILYFMSRAGLYTVDIKDKMFPFLTGYYELQTRLYDMQIKGDFAIFSMGDKGLCALDISNPARPLYAGGFNHRNDNMCMSLDIKDNYIFVANGTSNESIFILEYTF